MGNIPELERYDETVYRIEDNDEATGGPEAPVNRAAQALANRTKWLKAQVEALNSDWESLRGGAFADIGTGATQVARGNHSHPVATLNDNGFMSTTDKAAIAALNRSVVSQIFPSPGIFEWTAPEGVLQVMVHAVGGGAGSFGGHDGGYGVACQPGGIAGGVYGAVFSVTPGVTYYVKVGAGGHDSVYGGTNVYGAGQTAGTDTLFGADTNHIWLTAKAGNKPNSLNDPGLPVSTIDNNHIVIGTFPLVVQGINSAVVGGVYGGIYGNPAITCTPGVPAGAGMPTVGGWLQLVW